MNAEQAGALLATAAAFDNRKESDAATLAWAKALAGLNYADCDRAIVSYYCDGGKWIDPGDIIARVKVAQNERIDRAGLPAPSPDLTDNGRAYVLALRAAARDAVAPRHAIEGGSR